MDGDGSLLLRTKLHRGWLLLLLSRPEIVLQPVAQRGVIGPLLIFDELVNVLVDLNGLRSDTLPFEFHLVAAIFFLDV